MKKRFSSIGAAGLIAFFFLLASWAGWIVLTEVANPYVVCFEREIGSVKLNGQAVNFDSPERCVRLSQRWGASEFTYTRDGRRYRLSVWPQRSQHDSPLLIVSGQGVDGPSGSYHEEPSRAAPPNPNEDAGTP